jgi:phospholipase/carboxylesterase
MDVGFARGARALLEAGGLSVEYHESDAAHHIDPAHVPVAIQWLADATAEHRSATTTTTTEGR